jgi:hypothetical protein
MGHGHRFLRRGRGWVWGFGGTEVHYSIGSANKQGIEDLSSSCVCATTAVLDEERRGTEEAFNRGGRRRRDGDDSCCTKEEGAVSPHGNYGREGE